MSEFDELMKLGVASHVASEHDEALSYRILALNEASDDIESGRAKRDISASLHRGAIQFQGLESDPQVWVKGSISALESALEEGLPGAKRERGASREWMGRIILKSAVDFESISGTNISHAYTIAQESYIGALSDLREGEDDDQYLINALPNASIAYSLGGDSRKGWSLGSEALWLARWSESRKLSTSTEGLEGHAIVKSKLKVAGKASGALAVASSANINRSVALSIASKII